MPTLTMTSARKHGMKTMSVPVDDFKHAEKMVTDVLMLGNTTNPGEFSLSYVLDMAMTFLSQDGSESFTHETGREFPGEGFVKETVSYTI